MAVASSRALSSRPVVSILAVVLASWAVGCTSAFLALLVLLALHWPEIAYRGAGAVLWLVITSLVAVFDARHQIDLTLLGTLSELYRASKSSLWGKTAP